MPKVLVSGVLREGSLRDIPVSLGPGGIFWIDPALHLVVIGIDRSKRLCSWTGAPESACEDCSSEGSMMRRTMSHRDSRVQSTQLGIIFGGLGQVIYWLTYTSGLVRNDLQEPRTPAVPLKFAVGWRQCGAAWSTLRTTLSFTENNAFLITGPLYPWRFISLLIMSCNSLIFKMDNGVDFKLERSAGRYKGEEVRIEEEGSNFPTLLLLVHMSLKLKRWFWTGLSGLGFWLSLKVGYSLACSGGPSLWSCSLLKVFST